MFGPYAGLNPKFLKHGSYLDLLATIRPSNLILDDPGGARQPRPSCGT